MISRKTLANAIRILSIDAIQKANSGHPGMPMGMADIAEVLWRDYMNHNPQNPKWINRDRFVISNGHGSMLLYSLLHLTGYNLPIRELQNFRQLHSKTPGHPEYGETEGVETTTGPLGQGIANAVGMAIAERTLGAQFNTKEFNIIDHYTYVFLGDGCMMEGISHEACSLAGKLQLNKLITFYDDNHISIDGDTKEWHSEDTKKRFESYGWHVIRHIDGHNSDAIKKAIENARSVLDKPSLIICKTIIAYGSPNKSGSHVAHGAPLGKEEVSLTRKQLNWKSPAFVIPQNIYDHWNAKTTGENKENDWKKTFSKYQTFYPELAKEFNRRINKELPKSWDAYVKKIIIPSEKSNQAVATRQASQNILEMIGPILPELIGGSADLTQSNLTSWSGSTPITKNISGNYIHYGVREFGMTAIANGISVYGGFLPYTSTFLTFTGYMQNAIRMAALMKIRHIMIYTHDSIGLGEDGPTHQPIEHLSSLRMIPNLNVWRPCDYIETAVAWKSAVENINNPTVLILSRQNLPTQEYTTTQISNISKGGYILKDCKNNKPELIIISTGSEIQLAMKSYYQLTNKGINVRVISLPSTNIFDLQNEEYKNFILPSNVTKRIAIEASSHDYWYKYVGLNGKIIGMNTFGKSAPSKNLFKFFKFTVDTIIQNALYLLNK